MCTFCTVFLVFLTSFCEKDERNGTHVYYVNTELTPNKIESSCVFLVWKKNNILTLLKHL